MLKEPTSLLGRIPRFSLLSPRPYSSLQRPGSLTLLLYRHRSLHLTGSHAFPRRREFFSSNSHLQRPQKEAETEQPPKSQKRKHQRSPAGKNSLRRVAAEAQRSRHGKEARRTPSEDSQSSTKACQIRCAVLRVYADRNHRQ